MNINSKKILALVTIFLIVSMFATIFEIPRVNAQSKNTTYPFIDAIPNPVGVGQKH